MAVQYVITEAEMNSLMDQLSLLAMQEAGHFRNWQDPTEWDKRPPQLADLHRAFHYVAVRWAQSVGFKGHR